MSNKLSELSDQELTDELRRRESDQRRIRVLAEVERRRQYEAQRTHKIVTEGDKLQLTLDQMLALEDFFRVIFAEDEDSGS